jgi:hypothetical protein
LDLVNPFSGSVKIMLVHSLGSVSETTVLKRILSTRRSKLEVDYG